MQLYRPLDFIRLSLLIFIPSYPLPTSSSHVLHHPDSLTVQAQRVMYPDTFKRPSDRTAHLSHHRALRPDSSGCVILSLEVFGYNGSHLKFWDISRFVYLTHSCELNASFLADKVNASLFVWVWAWLSVSVAPPPRSFYHSSYWGY